jgi:hypothetical protein
MEGPKEFAAAMGGAWKELAHPREGQREDGDIGREDLVPAACRELRMPADAAVAMGSSLPCVSAGVTIGEGRKKKRANRFLCNQWQVGNFVTQKQLKAEVKMLSNLY